MADYSLAQSGDTGVTRDPGRTATLLRGLVYQAPFLLLAGLFVLVGLAAMWRWSPFGVVSPLELALYGARPLSLQLAVLAFFWPILALLAHRPRRPIGYLAAGARRHLSPGALLWSGPALLVCPFVFSTFSEFKTVLPYIRPFSFDALFARLDSALHFGVDPWIITHGLFGSETTTSVIQFFYLLWLFAFSVTFFWQIFNLRRPALRLRFLLSFIVCWSVLGMLAAVLLSSAGPIFYAEVVGIDRYAALMERLASIREETPLQTLAIRDELWAAYENPAAETMIRGISAMPSMHVSMSVLMALLGWQYGRVAGWAGTAFAAIIMIGSVHLAWHYAIDGYVAAAGTVFIWHVCGRFTSFWHGRMAAAGSVGPPEG